MSSTDGIPHPNGCRTAVNGLNQFALLSRVDEPLEDQTVRVATAGETRAARRAGSSVETSPTVHNPSTPPTR